MGWGTRLEKQIEYASDSIYQVEMVCSVVARCVGKPIYLRPKNSLVLLRSVQVLFHQLLPAQKINQETNVIRLGVR